MTDAPSNNSVGVVAIGRNEGDRLKRCLQSAVEQTVRVVYVDSGSTDDSCAFARSLGVEVVDLDTSIPFTAARARNAGMARLFERWPDVVFVQFVDGDCEIVETWIPAAITFMNGNPDTAVVCGRRRERFPEATIYNRLTDLEWDTPIGTAKSCGGDALFRRSCIEHVNGYRESLIAGEEPELCVRLRAEGWTVYRIDEEMTLHDAAITRFGEFWKRSKRAGHAYAEGAALHGKGPDKHGVRGTRSAVIWGLLIPFAALAGAWWTFGLSVIAACGLYGIQMWRVRGMNIRRGRSASDASATGVFTMLTKPAQASGVVRYWVRRFTGRRPALIEYKGAAAHGAPDA